MVPLQQVLPAVVAPAEENPDPVFAPSAVSEASCAADEPSMRQRMLQLINDARAMPRACGPTNFEAASPLVWNDTLASATLGHSQDMATNNFFSHTGSDGQSAAARVTAAGYYWWTVGENISAGQETAALTVNDWLESPGHCRNLMDPSYTELAVSCVVNNDSDFRRYWTNVLAAPR